MITSMRRWVTSLGVLAVGGLSVDAACYATFALWPQQIDATLSLSVNADGLSVVEASHGGVLGTFNMKVDTKSEVQLDPVIDTIEITWVPTTNAQSSTFDQFLAHSSRVDGTNAVGIHLQAKLRDGSSWSAINETHHERIEGNVLRVLQNILPSIEILPSLAEGFLAKSMCDFHTWKTSNPLEENLRDPVSRLCFSSSFPLSSKDGVLFYSKTIGEAKAESIYSGESVVERVLFEMKKNLATTQHKHKLAVVKIGRGPASSIEAEYLEAWIASLSDAKKPWKTVLPVSETKSDAFVVRSIARGLDGDKLEHIWLQRGGKPIGVGTPPSHAEIEILTASIAASIQTDIAGEGFHRRFVMDVEVLESEICGNASQDKMILVRVPVSNAAYIDLDEIRRMERFGELKLLSFTKHIEIERPSPVSSQHVVGLEFTMPSTNKMHIEFPIHFRYQAPSESDLYRQASVTPPDIFLFCQDGDQSAMKNHKLLGDDAVRSYFQVWGLFSQETSGGDNSYWLRLLTTTPLPVTEVLIPVGYLPSEWLVSSVTLLFASMGAALLLWVSVGVAKRSQSPSANAANWKGKTD